jgi:tetratricopeptide (TPR) repeat protein/TolB-like protein
MPVTPGARLGPYEVLAPLGAGGMGEVFKARDTRLGRDVAIKVLPAGLAADPDRRRRFEQEARAVAALSHPHICVLHDIGSQDGIDFLVMEYLEGETLAARLRASRFGEASPGSPLPLKEALEIGAQVADALGAAHRRGIVHRDLKPANIMLTPTGGVRRGSPQVKLLDFGLAKLRPEREPGGAGQSAVTTEAPLTGDHQLLGTVPYMAPEQLEGKPVDARTDVFALGCVLYEMLTGRRAFEGTSSATVMAAILTSEPPVVSALQPITPPLLDRLVQTCLAKRPDDRWDSAHDVAEQLRAISDAGAAAATTLAAAPAGTRRTWWTRRRVIVAGAMAIVAMVAAVVSGYLWSHRAPAPPRPQAAETTPATPTLDPNRVVVALFENRTGDPGMDVVAQMATDILTRCLSQSGELAVSLNPAVAARGRPAEEPPSTPTSADVLRTLAVQTEAGLVVAGAIYQEDETLRIESRLVDATTGELIAQPPPATGPRRAPSAAIAALGDRLISAVAGVVRRELHAGATHVPPYEAYRAYEQALAAWGVDYDASIRHVERAFALDPSWFFPRFFMFGAYANRNMFTQAAEQLRLLEQHVGDLTPVDEQNLRSARALMAGNWTECLEAVREIDRLAPGIPMNRMNLALTAMAANQPHLAEEALGRASASVPGSKVMTAWTEFAHADAYHLLGRFAEELELARRSRRQFPAMVGFVGREARALVALGRTADAARVADESLAVQRAAAVPVGTELTVIDQIDPGQLMCLVSMELAAHGHPQEALAMARRAVVWFEARSARDRTAPSHRWLLALAKFLAEDWAGARVLYEPLADLEQPIQPPGFSPEMAFALAVRFRGRLGVIAARSGERAAAERVAKQLGAVERRYLFGEHLFQRAAIAAQLGDKEKAVELLREAIAQGFGGTLDYLGYAECLHRVPEMAPLRGYPPFEELIKPKG